MNRETIEQFVINRRYSPHVPTPKQAVFLLMPHLEILFGGAAGGGKSDALLMAALQYVHVPGYSALLLRRTYTDLALPRALLDRARDWLTNTDAQWNAQEKTWRFPSGASLTFGYLESPSDRYRYQSSEFQFVGFDELTQFHEREYLYLFSRLRRQSGVHVPLRMRAATNPGGIGHDWVKQRFITEKHRNRLFIPARIEDNPFLDESYRTSLEQLPFVERRQLQYGDWDVMASGNYFRREWWHLLSEQPPVVRTVRAWDLASTEPSATNPDPDWSVGLLLGETADGAVVLDVQRFRASPGSVVERILQTARMDGQATRILIEQESGASGKLVLNHLQQHPQLRGYTVLGVRPDRNKIARAQVTSADCEHGRLSCMVANWTDAFLSELARFPDSEHDDQVDALNYAYAHIRKSGIIRISV